MSRPLKRFVYCVLLLCAPAGALGCRPDEPEDRAALSRQYVKCADACRKLADKNKARCSGPAQAACETAVEATYFDCTEPCKKAFLR